MIEGGKNKGTKNMRSDDVFAAAKKIGNRFLLCRVASVSAHRLQAGSRPFTESINKSLKVIATMVPPVENGSIPGELRMTDDHPFLTPLGDVKSERLANHPPFKPLLVKVG
jgi:hypothetical protein